MLMIAAFLTKALRSPCLKQCQDEWISVSKAFLAILVT
jgi:hypothetical protein